MVMIERVRDASCANSSFFLISSQVKFAVEMKGLLNSIKIPLPCLTLEAGGLEDFRHMIGGDGHLDQSYA